MIAVSYARAADPTDASIFQLMTSFAIFLTAFRDSRHSTRRLITSGYLHFLLNISFLVRNFVVSNIAELGRSQFYSFPVFL